MKYGPSFLWFRLKKIFMYTFVPSKLRSKFQENYFQKNADAFLISFPKCGRTWLTVMLGYLFNEIYGPFPERYLLRLKQMHLINRNVPLVVKTHDQNRSYTSENLENAGKNIEFYRDSKIIYLYRNPLDVLVSFYHQAADRSQSFDGTLEEFIEAEERSIQLILNYYNKWAEKISRFEETHIISYEDLHDDTNRELHKLVNFLNLPNVTEPLIKKAVDYAEFDNMREMEQDDKFDSGVLQPNDPDDVDSYKTRKGKTGTYREEIPEDLIPGLEKKITQQLSDFYPYNNSNKEH